MTTIIYCHPSTDSYNYAVFKKITEILTGRGEEYYVINLYGEGFDPVLDSLGLKSYAEGEAHDEMAARYATTLARSSRVIMIFPIWWGMMPAMLKGFFDKVLLRGTAYDFSPEGLMLPCLSVESTLMVTTSEEDSSVLEPFMQGYLPEIVLNAVGMNNVEWLNLEHISKCDSRRREEFMGEVLKRTAR